VWEKGDYTPQDAMDPALLTGQRPADVLKLTRADIRDGALVSVHPAAFLLRHVS